MFLPNKAKYALLRIAVSYRVWTFLMTRKEGRLKRPKKDFMMELYFKTILLHIVKFYLPGNSIHQNTNQKRESTEDILIKHL